MRKVVKPSLNQRFQIILSWLYHEAACPSRKYPRWKNNMIESEHQYLMLLDEILSQGNEKGDRTGTGTRSVFGRQLRFDLSKGFPLLTTKKMAWKAIVHELLWFISGD